MCLAKNVLNCSLKMSLIAVQLRENGVFSQFSSVTVENEHVVEGIVTRGGSGISTATESKPFVSSSGTSGCKSTSSGTTGSTCCQGQGYGMAT